MNVDVFAEEHCVVELLTRTKILGAFLHQEGVDTLVGSRQTHPHGLQSGGAEQSLADR